MFNKCQYCKPFQVCTKDHTGKEVKEWKHDVINFAHPPYGSVYNSQTPTAAKKDKTK